MRKDPIVAEIHKFREAHARKFNYDLDAIFDDLQQKQAKRKNLASLPPIKPAVPCAAEGHAVYRIMRPAKT
ncbi:MAG: hypothetical protein WCI95_13010 [bacterium]|jgi:hypothetical protein